MNIPIKQILLNESADIFGGKLKRAIIGLCKPFKKYGSTLPNKPDIPDVLDIHDFSQTKSGPGQLFDYHELLRDSRPARVKMVG